MLVHIGVTDHALDADRDRVANVLRDAGTDVSVADSTVDAVGHADALVCLIGRAGALLSDGRHLGESAVATAFSYDVPTLAYDVTGNATDPPTDHRAGYAVTRVASLRRRLRHGGVLTPVADRSGLPFMVLRDLSRTSRLLRQTTPDAFRALHRRIRDHPAVTYEAFSLSMHNVDQLYWVHEVPRNSEVAGRYQGAEPGGAGANTMVALRRLGLSTAVAGAIGDDDEGAMLQRALEDDEVATTLLVTVSGVTTGRNVMLRASDGGYSNVVDGGANEHLEQELERRGMRRVLLETAARSRVVHLTAFATSAGRQLQAEMLYEVPDETIVSYKPGTMDAEQGIDGLETVVGRCDALFIAEAELDALLRYQPEFAADMNVSAKLDLLFAWRERHHSARPLIIAVVAGMGPSQVDPVHLHWGTARHEGMVRPDRTTQVGPPAVKDFAGARDAIVAGVLFGLLRSRPPIDCVNLAYVLAVSAFEEYGCRRALLRPISVRERWRQLLGSEPPRWLDPYG